MCLQFRFGHCQDSASNVTIREHDSLSNAAVLQRVDDSSRRVVLAARSLRPVEERTSRLLVMTALAWGALLVTSVIAALL